MIELRAFGTLATREAGNGNVRDVPLAPRQAALLAYLALARPRGRVTRDRLVGVFWPELEESRARAALSQSLYRLRIELGHDVIENGGDTAVGLRPGQVVCDVLAFEDALDDGRVEEALDGWGGELLAGFHLAGAPDFEHWLDDQRTRLRERAVGSASALASRLEAEGDPAGAAHWLRRALAWAPHEEGLVRELTRLLAAAGDPNGALHEFDRYSRRLSIELELEPSPALLEHMDALRSIRRMEPATQESSLRIPDAAAPSRSAGSRTEEVEQHASDRTARDRPVRPGLPGYVRRRRHRGRNIAAAALVFTAPGIAGVAVLRGASLRDRPGSPSIEVAAPSPSRLDPKRVLVAPLDNLTGSAAFDATGIIAADRIAHGLQQTGLVEVIDPATARLLWNAAGSGPSGTIPAQVRETVEVTRAGTLVTGSYHVNGSDLVFDVNVTDARNGTVLRTIEPITRAMVDPTPAMEELRERVMGALGTLLDERLAGIVTTPAHPPTWKAYVEFALGIEQFSQADVVGADAHFERAARLDTTFLLPRLWMIFATEDRARFYDRNDSLLTELERRQDGLPPVERAAVLMYVARRDGEQEIALAAARRAARLAPTSNWAWKAADLAYRLGRPREALATLGSLDPMRGWVRGWNPYWILRTEALRALGEYEAALALERSAEAALRGTAAERTLHQYRIIDLVARGRVDEALEQVDADIRGRMAGDPIPIGHVWAANLLRSTGAQLRWYGHRVAALRLFDRCVEWLDRMPSSESTRELQSLKRDCLYDAGRWQEAYDLARALDAASQSGLVSPHTALAAARLGRTDEAEKVLRDTQRPGHRQWNWRWALGFTRARLAAALGQKERALEYLREVDEPGSLINPIRASGDFDILSGDPVFEALLRPLR